MFLFPKREDKDGKNKWMMVTDFRELNSFIKEDKFPLSLDSNIPGILDN